MFLLGYNEGSARNLSLTRVPWRIKKNTSRTEFIPFGMKVGEELARASCWHLWQQLSFIEYFGEDIEFYKRDPTLSQGLSVLWTWALQMCRILVRAFSTRSRALAITILQFRIWAPLVVPAYREGGVWEQFLRVHPMPAKTIKSGQDQIMWVSEKSSFLLNNRSNPVLLWPDHFGRKAV